ncbi:MAG: MarR family transcriptional regulator [Nocardioides sp.]|jgi:DNA-binding MarR family transcriptional regulator|nr:MarR family transcriptional regulator [Nocardioides sp.]
MSDAVDATFPQLDPVIHPPHRLQICALLHASREVEFARLRDHLGVSDSVLSKQLAHLMDAGYVTQRKALKDSRHRVWLRLTTRGRTAYQHHLAALRAILDTAQQ